MFDKIIQKYIHLTGWYFILHATFPACPLLLPNVSAFLHAGSSKKSVWKVKQISLIETKGILKKHKSKFLIYIVLKMSAKDARERETDIITERLV